MASLGKSARGENKRGDMTLDDEERAFRSTDDDLLAEARRSRPSDDQLLADADDPTVTSDGDHPKTDAIPYHFVPLQLEGRTHMPTAGSAALVEEIGGLPALEGMTYFFYNNAFQDATLDKFIRSHDDPHAKRFARWIIQKLVPNSSVWDEDRDARSKEPVEVANGHTVVVHDRSSAHLAAWHSPKRPRDEVGRHFKLDESRVWMRLHFWAMRKVIGGTSPSFVDYYVRFIGHFVNVYENAAPAFARESYRWSENPDNIQVYLDNGRRMGDILGLTVGQALGQLPEDEASDAVWPYV